MGPQVLDANLGVGIGHQQQVLQSGQVFEDFVEFGALVERLASIAVAGTGDQHLGLDLAEAVDHAVGAEVWRAAGPGRSQAAGGEHADQGLPGVRHAGRDPVADPDASLAQALLQAGDMGGQFGVGEGFPAAVLADGDHHREMVVAPAQQVFGEVQRGLVEPAGAGHLLRFDQHAAGRVVELDSEEIDDGLPEVFAALDAEAVQDGD